MCDWTYEPHFWVTWTIVLRVFFPSANHQYFLLLLRNLLSVHAGVTGRNRVNVWSEHRKHVQRETLAFRRTHKLCGSSWKTVGKQSAPACKPYRRAALASFSQHNPRISIENRWLALHNACNPTQTALLEAWDIKSKHCPKVCSIMLLYIYIYILKAPQALNWS